MPKSEPNAFSGLPEFRAKLEANGWRIYRGNFRSEWNGCDWYAVSPDKSGIAPDCECNDRPPAFVVWPCTMFVHDVEREDVKAKICGEAAGNWLELQAVAMTPDDFFERWPLVRRQLVAAWSAAASIKD